MVSYRPEHFQHLTIACSSSHVFRQSIIVFPVVLALVKEEKQLINKGVKIQANGTLVLLSVTRLAVHLDVGVLALSFRS